MAVLVCPGIHPPALTAGFLHALAASHARHWYVLPAAHPPYAPQLVLAYLRQQLGQPPERAPAVLFVGFSAGVVGALGAARAWQRQGGRVSATIAIDGWGVPLGSSFPEHRLSHDRLTHCSSALLGAGRDGFYSDPPVAHRALWGQPQCPWGWWLLRPGCRVRCTAAEFLQLLLARYGER